MIFCIISLLLAWPPQSISIATRDSLTVRQGIYSSLFFLAEPSHVDTGLPQQYRFSESGLTPPGMKFESYPCNKPNAKVCPELASSNGLYLDGTPTKPGSYNFVLTVENPDGEKASRHFTIIVKAASR
jgi:hypothetical protein